MNTRILSLHSASTTLLQRVYRYSQRLIIFFQFFLRSLSRSKSRSRSHSFSPPPPGENGKTTEEEKPNENDEETRQREEAINALPPYYPALQVNIISYFLKLIVIFKP